MAHQPNVRRRSHRPLRLNRQTEALHTISSLAGDSWRQDAERSLLGPDTQQQPQQINQRPPVTMQGVQGNSFPYKVPPNGNNQGNEIQYYSDDQQETYMAPAGAQAGGPTATPEDDDEPTMTFAYYQPTQDVIYTTSTPQPSAKTTLGFVPQQAVSGVQSLGTSSSFATSEPSFSGPKPTTMTNGLSVASLSSLRPTSVSTTSARAPVLFKTSSIPPAPIISDSPLDGDSPSSPRSHPMSSTLITAIVLALSIAFTIAVLVLRRRYIRRKAKAAALHREQLERDYMATKDSSIFGGNDIGSPYEAEKDRSATLPSGPSWVSVMDTLQVPGMAASRQAMDPQGRFSRRGSGWMVLPEGSSSTSETVPAPASTRRPSVRFADAPEVLSKQKERYSRDSRYSSGTEEDAAVIATAARVPAVSSVAKPLPTAYNKISPYHYQKASEVRPYHPNLHPQPVNPYWGTGAARPAANGTIQPSPVRPQAPLRVTKKPVRGVGGRPDDFGVVRHQGRASDDEQDPFVHDRQTASRAGNVPSPDMRYSMGTLMMTHYDEAGSMDPPSPVMDEDSIRRIAAGAPQVTVTSASTKTVWQPLSQMAMAKAQPDYRSPTYSIYNMYDGDDEGRRASAAAEARRSLAVPGRSK